MKRITVLGVDLAKDVFHIYGSDAQGREVVKRQFGRGGLLRFLSNLKPCLIGMEACGGAHYWSRECRRMGHEVRLMPPQYVKPYVKTNKNDFNDAEAIWEAVQRPNMRFVPQKTVEQQEIQMLHRSRSLFVRSRTRVCNEVRGFLAELGIFFPKGVKRTRQILEQLLSQDDLRLNETAKFILTSHRNYFDLLQLQLERLETKVNEIFESNPKCQRLATIPGIGPITATAIIAAIPDIDAFRSGRHLAAWWGLVPRQNSSGGKTQLGSISKRGDNYIRTLLIHGGRTVVRSAEQKADKRSQWIASKAKTRGKNKAAVAVANKNARVIWKLLKTEEVYRTVA
jgi:transposase